MSDKKSKELQMISPSGVIQVSEIKNVNVSNLIKFCDEDYAKALKLTSDDVKNIGKYLGVHGSGDFKSVPMVCLAEACSISSQCPLQAAGKAPLGKLCPFEQFFMEKWRDEYIISLKADWDDKIERALVMELVEIDILNARANAYLATEGFIMENVVGINEQTGEPLIRKEEHIALSVKTKVQARRDKILKSMVATREAKTKLFTAIKDDASTYSAKLRERARQMEEQHDVSVVMDGEIKDTEKTDKGEDND